MHWGHDPVQHLLSTVSEDTAFENAEYVYSRIKKHYHEYVMQYDELAVILVNPDFYNRNMGPYITVSEILLHIDSHIDMANSFLQSAASSLDPPIRPPNFFTRNHLYPPTRFKTVPKGNLADQVLPRDNYKCIVTELANPEAAHIFPWSAASDPGSLSKTARNWDITATLVNVKFHNEQRVSIDQSRGFQVGWNSFSLTPNLHKWVDRGFWAFWPQYRKIGETDLILKFYWMPGGFNDSGKRVLPDHLRRCIHKIYDKLDRDRKAKYRARNPARGTGYIGAHLRQKNALVESGHLFKVQYSSSWDAERAHDMVTLQWKIMLLQTLRGVTKSG